MHHEILSDAQKRLLPFVKSHRREFYLVGGTAIALQIGHRRSIDFDLFKKTRIRRERLAASLRDAGIEFQLLFADAEGMHVLADGVKLTFFEFPFDIPAKLGFEGIRLPDLLTLAAMKAYALGRRAKWKDYVDLYFILRDHHGLEAVAERAGALFPGLFSGKLFRQQLCYFEDIDYSEEVDYLPGHEIDGDVVKGFLQETALNGI